MKQILFNSWNPKTKVGNQVRNDFAPFSFVEQESMQLSPEIYEVRRILTFSVMTRLNYGDRSDYMVQENADRELLRLVAGPFVKQAQTLMNSLYARDFETSMSEMAKLMDLLTKGQIALDEQAQ